MSSGCILIEEGLDWRVMIADPRVPQSPHPSERITGVEPAVVAIAVREAIRKLQGKPKIVLAPESRSCFFANLPADITDRQSMQFEMEASLPFDAESSVADFSFHDEVISGVAIDAERWEPLITALEDANIAVESIVPVAVLTASALLSDGKVSSGDVLILSTTTEADLLLLSDHGFHSWRNVSSQSNRFPLELRAMRSKQREGGDVVRVGVARDDEAEHFLSVDLVAAAARGAARVLQRREPPWYELRRGTLASGDPMRAFGGPLKLMVSAAAVMLIAMTVAGFVRKSRLDSAVASVQKQQAAVFEDAFPGVRRPAATLTRMRSEHRKALGSRQTGSAVPQATSATDVLDAFLRGVSNDIRCRFPQIVILNGDLRADVELRMHNDAGQLAASLEAQGFAMRPPGTEQLNPSTVVSQLEGTLSPIASTSGNTATDRQPQNGSQP